jgi:hypothetical protein
LCVLSCSSLSIVCRFMARRKGRRLVSIKALRTCMQPWVMGVSGHFCNGRPLVSRPVVPPSRSATAVRCRHTHSFWTLPLRRRRPFLLMTRHSLNESMFVLWLVPPPPPCFAIHRWRPPDSRTLWGARGAGGGGGGCAVSPAARPRSALSVIHGTIHDTRQQGKDNRPTKKIEPHTKKKPTHREKKWSSVNVSDVQEERMSACGVVGHGA